jgi:large subunit ribosomal protein L6
VGKRPIELPKGVSATITATKIEIKGPKGTLSRGPFSNVDIKLENNAITVKPTVPGRDGARFQGLARALLASMVEGTANGYTKTLQLVGTGYRAEVKGPVLNLALGFSHPINFKIPAGIKIEVPAESKGTIINMSGPDKAVMGQTAATIRGFRPPEPYGGKGVRHMGEKVREKAGKAGGKGGK